MSLPNLYYYSQLYSCTLATMIMALYCFIYAIYQMMEYNHVDNTAHMEALMQILMYSCAIFSSLTVTILSVSITDRIEVCFGVAVVGFSIIFIEILV